jgi:hypothetical protein
LAGSARTASRALTAAAILIGTLRIVATYPVFNHTIDEPAPGWNAVSITAWKVLRMGLTFDHPGIVVWDRVKATERLGRGVLLYYFPPSELR